MTGIERTISPEIRTGKPPVAPGLAYNQTRCWHVSSSTGQSLGLMSPILIIRMFSTCTVLLGVFSAAYGSGETWTWFRQTNGRQPPGLHEEAAGPSPLPAASIGGTTETSAYDLHATFDIASTTALRTTAGMRVSGENQDDPDLATLWKTIEATASASDTLVDFAVVQGAAGSGTVEFHWTVSGQTMLGLEQNDKVNVELLSGLTMFRSSPGDVLLNEFHHFPGGGGNYEMAFPVTAQRIMFPMPWHEGQEIPLVFELASRVDLKAHNRYFDDFGRGGAFQAELAAEFGNSAVLDGVLIRDEAGQPMPGATLMSRNGSFTYPIVPEPGCGWLLLFGAGVAAGSRRRFRGGSNAIFHRSPRRA